MSGDGGRIIERGLPPPARRCGRGGSADLLLLEAEEGGGVARIGNNPNFPVQHFESMGAIGATGDPQNAFNCGNVIGQYLKHYGFDVDLAPVADVNTNPKNPVIGKRAFSSDPQLAAQMVGSSNGMF